MSALHTKVQKKESKTNTQTQTKKTSSREASSFDEISQLQSSIGNQAIQNILNNIGVQAKLSLGSEKMTDNSHHERFTIIGLLDKYILKPQTELYQQLPDNLILHIYSM